MLRSIDDVSPIISHANAHPLQSVAEPRFQFRGGKIEKKNTKNKSNLKLLIDNKNKINREL